MLLGSAALAIGLVLGPLLWPVLRGRVYVRGELGNYTLHGRAFYADCLERGDAFVWWPHLDGGLFVHGLGQLGLYHPLRYAQYLMVPLPWSFGVEVLLSYPVLLAGMYWLLRRW
ncbi:MAG: hypothetical protein O7G30_12430, partial [Proteobacteria bacterium]|nr:hypothetical protein [Pseudomonadota bacterium]